MTSALTHLAAGTELVEPVAGGAQLVLAALAGIALIVVLITIVKLHPFLALIFGALTVGMAAGRTSATYSPRSPAASVRPRPASEY